jgi:hypothetical protein
MGIRESGCDLDRFDVTKKGGTLHNRLTRPKSVPPSTRLQRHRRSGERSRKGLELILPPFLEMVRPEGRHRRSISLPLEVTQTLKVQEMISLTLHSGVLALSAKGKTSIREILEQWIGRSVEREGRQSCEVAKLEDGSFVFSEKTAISDDSISNKWIDFAEVITTQVTSVVAPIGEAHGYKLYAFIAPYDEMKSAFVDFALKKAGAESCRLAGDLRVKLGDYVAGHTKAANSNIFEASYLRGFERVKVGLDNKEERFEVTFDASDRDTLKEIGLSAIKQQQWDRDTTFSVVLNINNKMVRVQDDLSTEFEFSGEGPAEAARLVRDIFKYFAGNISVSNKHVPRKSRVLPD